MAARSSQMSPQQVVMQVIYPTSAASNFDMEYYLNTHIPLVEKRWCSQGLQAWTVTTGQNSTNYHVQTTLIWKDMEALKNAEFVEELADDVKNFTDATPTRWIGTVIGQRIVRL
ncbi:hypothetical protein N7510_007757 [Penicillium lagena]|uniref:uncharacterized protein n=1 Tax=Penicillium lagena TaxID=94218 RepID=UPI00253FC972|nr:uncharacterized protein N7510_007757 [Penicillium lagena]KAJ5611038.1 hypothetical protein N7510_007757 [Penicillium lagena]